MTREIAILRSTVWRTHLLQAAVCVTGTVMAWNAVTCGLIGHHGDACLCAIGILINYATFEIAAYTCAYARRAQHDRGMTASHPASSGRDLALAVVAASTSAGSVGVTYVRRLQQLQLNEALRLTGDPEECSALRGTITGPVVAGPIVEPPTAVALYGREVDGRRPDLGHHDRLPRALE
jgi:hypothetical protein